LGLRPEWHRRSDRCRAPHPAPHGPTLRLAKRAHELTGVPSAERYKAAWRRQQRSRTG
jgi:hypothetical protein